MIRRSIRRSTGSRTVIHNEGLQRGRITRRGRRYERGMVSSAMGGSKSLKEFDKICRKYSDVEAETKGDLGRILVGIEDDARKLGLAVSLEVMDGVNGSPHYNRVSVDEFMRKVVSPSWFDGQNVSVDFVDGEPGDQYMLCFHGEDPDDISECASFFVTDAYGMYENRNMNRRNIVRRGRR